MKQIYFLLILLSATMMASAQIPMAPSPQPGNSNNCTTNPNIDVCPPNNNTVVGSHIGGVYHRGNNSNRLGANAVWRFRNMATVSNVTVNVEVTIDQISNAILENIDDDNAKDEAGKSISHFFAPRISPDQNLNGTNRRGYVQFTMKFYKNASGRNNNSDADFVVPVSLANLNYVHYDIDGNNANNVNSGTAGSWFRETGAAKKVTSHNPSVLANAVTELSSYGYTDEGADWTGFAGTIYERDGVSRCAQVASSFSYAGSQPGITVRMGYDYNAGGNIGRPVRQYGSRLGCFNFPSLSTLPVNLVNFAAIFNNDVTKLQWSSTQELNFDKYIIERSQPGSDYKVVGEVKGRGATDVENYEWSEDLSQAEGTVFYYRLKMLDIDGQFTYSSVAMVKKETKAINGILLSPNPVQTGTTTVRFSASRPALVQLKVVDISGKVLIHQMRQVAEGQNSVPLENLNRLQPGVYFLQLVNDGESSVLKFSIAR